MVRQTARLAEPISGDQLYQERARAALPLLVRQAHAGQPITYSALAEELGMPNPRNLNYPLGSIGRTLEGVSKTWKEKVPPLQFLVVNQTTGLPGEGVSWFMRDWGDFASLGREEKRRVISGAHGEVCAYPRWLEVLTAVGLQPMRTDFRDVVGAAVNSAGRGWRGGESARHQALKKFVAETPGCLGLPASTPRGREEYLLPSNDCLDVSFHTKDQWVAAEVKTTLSDVADVTRGLFQCVKYKALMEAVQKAEELHGSVKAILVLESNLPESLIPRRNILGIEVRENIVPV